MDDDDDFEFEANAFDHLGAEALQQLEARAFISTQQPRLTASGRAPQKSLKDSVQDPDNYGFDDEPIIDLNAEPISIPRANSTSSVNIPHRTVQTTAPFQSGAPLSQFANGRPRPASVQKQAASSRGLNGSFHASQAARPSGNGVPPPATLQPSRDDAEKEALRARLRAVRSHPPSRKARS